MVLSDAQGVARLRRRPPARRAAPGGRSAARRGRPRRPPVTARPARAATRHAVAYPQTRPWHRPMPGRASSFTVRASAAPRSSGPVSSGRRSPPRSDTRPSPASATRASRPAPGTPPGDAGRTRRPRDRRPRAPRVACRSTARPSDAPAAASPAISPSASDRSAPPTPVASPATNTPAPPPAWSSSTRATRLPSASRSCATAELERELRLGREPVPDGDRVAVELLLRPGDDATRGVEPRHPHAGHRVPAQRLDDGRPGPVRHAVAAQDAEVARALAHLRPAPQGRQWMPRERGRATGLEHAHDRRARLGEPGRDRQQERPGAGDDDPPPHHDAVPLRSAWAAPAVYTPAASSPGRAAGGRRRRWRARPSAPGPRGHDRRPSRGR